MTADEQRLLNNSNDRERTKRIVNRTKMMNYQINDVKWNSAVWTAPNRISTLSLYIYIS